MLIREMFDLRNVKLRSTSTTNNILKRFHSSINIILFNDRLYDKLLHMIRNTLTPIIYHITFPTLHAFDMKYDDLTTYNFDE